MPIRGQRVSKRCVYYNKKSQKKLAKHQNPPNSASQFFYSHLVGKSLKSNKSEFGPQNGLLLGGEIMETQRIQMVLELFWLSEGSIFGSILVQSPDRSGRIWPEFALPVFYSHLAASFFLRLLIVTNGAGTSSAPPGYRKYKYAQIRLQPTRSKCLPGLPGPANEGGPRYVPPPNTPGTPYTRVPKSRGLSS